MVEGEAEGTVGGGGSIVGIVGGRVAGLVGGE